MTFRRQMLLSSLAVLLLASASQAQDGWMLLSREDGCVRLDLLARAERLSHVPASPDEFAAMIRPRYPALHMGLPDGFPPEMAGRVVMVRYAENRAPIFVRADICRAIGSR